MSSSSSSSSPKQKQKGKGFTPACSLLDVAESIATNSLKKKPKKMSMAVMEEPEMVKEYNLKLEAQKVLNLTQLIITEVSVQAGHVDKITVLKGETDIPSAITKDMNSRKALRLFHTQLLTDLSMITNGRTPVSSKLQITDPGEHLEADYKRGYQERKGGVGGGESN